MMTDDDDEDDDDDYDDDDDDENPLKDGINSVSWLPSVIGGKSTAETTSSDESEILPVFPLGGLVYTPNSEHILNIFEPRYRQMYTDILMNGSKRFVVVMSHPSKQGTFAKVGVLFELLDLKEVSEQTADQIKYICSHKVTGRVNLTRIINPEAWESRETYLKAEGFITDDTKVLSSDDEEEDKDDTSDKGVDDVYGVVAAAASKSTNTQEENALRESFKSMVDIQHELEEDVRFTRSSVDTLAVADGPGKDGLWQTIRLWQAYVEQRFRSKSEELQLDFQQKLQDYLMKDRNIENVEELPSVIGFQDLSPSLQEEVQELQKRMTSELEPLLLESTLSMQKILESTNHKTRCNLVRYFVDAERKRLTAKKTLQGMFNSSNSNSDSSSSISDSSSSTNTLSSTAKQEESKSKSSSSSRGDERDDESNKNNNDESDSSSSSSSGGSIFPDDEDAFQ